MQLGGAAVTSTTKRVSNVSGGLGLKSATMAGPSLAALVALAGVTLPPALSLSDSERQLAFARERAAQFEREFARSSEYAEADIAARVARALEQVRARTPITVDPVVAQGSVRLAAQRAGLHLDTLTLGSERDPGLEQTSDRVVMTLVELIGSGSLFAPVRLQRELESMGLPCCVLEANAALAKGSGARSELRLLLGLLHFAAPLATDERSIESASEEFP